MQRIPYSDFTKLILANIKSISADIATEYVKLSCIDFCTSSQVLRRFRKDDLICGLDEYPILIRDGEETLVSIYSCYVNGSKIEIFPDGTSEGNFFSGNYCYVKDNNTIIIKPTPIQYIKNGISYTISVAPTVDSCSIDYLIYEKYYETIIYGALSKLYIMKDTKWYDPKLAVYNKDMFNNNTLYAGLNRSLGYSRRKQKIGRIPL